MTKEEEIALYKKRRVDLACLGINPNLYFICSKFLNNIIYVVVRDENTYLFYQKSYNNSRKRGSVDELDVLSILIDALGVGEDILTPIIREWIREMEMRYKMSQDAIKYWEYLTLPIVPEEIVESYNF